MPPKHPVLKGAPGQSEVVEHLVYRSEHLLVLGSTFKPDLCEDVLTSFLNL